MAAGMKDVASLAGVAVGTVSNVLNHPDLVRPLTRARVEAAMEELGFIPNGSARQLRAGRSRCLGLADIEFVADAAVPLTSVRRPKYQLGRAAAELLLEEADRPDEHEHRRIIFKPELVARASSGEA